MKQPTPSIEYFGRFSDIFREQVHQLLALGYHDARPRIRSSAPKDQEEPAITGYIVSALRDRKRSLHRQPQWIKHYSFYDDPPRTHQEKTGRHRPRADIVIEWSELGSPEFVIEAKRLQKSSHGVNKYVDSGGMGCFVSGRYAARYDEAGMLGYVQSGSVGEWERKVRSAIEENAASLRLRLPQEGVHFPSAFPLEWYSRHVRRTVGREIRIFHILLDCCTD